MSLLTKSERYQSWGRYPKLKNAGATQLLWRNDLPDLNQFEQTVLPYGYGRSYGDSCLNEGGIHVDTSLLQRFISFDETSGLLCCEAGVSLDEVLRVFVPRGWFIPVSPGTKFVTVGGAIANDVHGKNHHKDGTFGCHVTRFELLRSDGTRLLCSPSENVEFFQATIGGLGLTGLILWAEFRLKRIASPFIKMENIRFDSLAEFFEVSAESDTGYQYTVAWVDCIAKGKSMGRGLFGRGNFYNPGIKDLPPLKPKRKLQAPFDVPSFMLGTPSFQAFNTAYYHIHWRKRQELIVHYEPFYYPLDSIHEWNKLYGKPGFLQYQFVLPDQDKHVAISEVFQRISASGQSTNVAVLKTFGPAKSPGMMSFPRPGVTLAVDFTYKGEKTLRLLNELDQIVLAAGGRLYPAKDARMSAAAFQTSFPNWRDFAHYIDPKFSSSFWRRVTQPLSEAEQPNQKNSQKAVALQPV
jgi:FAD/FMN-containing dehydrogenase